MDDAIHSAAGTLDRLLKSVHCANHVFFEGVSHQDMILLGITIIGTRPREIVDPVECVAIATGATRSIFGWRVRRCATKFRCAVYKSHDRRHLAKEISPSVVSHRISPSNRSFEKGTPH